MDKSKLYMVEHLVSCIEAKLGWGNGKNWSNSDFETLSEQIFEATKKRLSVTTLKRIWGRAERIANPSAATLNILSQFMGHADWRDFVNSQKSDTDTPAFIQIPWQKILAIIGVLTIGVALLALNWDNDKQPIIKEVTYHKADFEFKSRTIAKGLPNSVVFDYDVSAAADDAKIEIQQSWDTSKRITINRNDSVATCIYRRPGFFNAKLVVDGTIVEAHDVFIPTQGWLGLIERDSIPLYLDNENVERKGELSISSNVLSDYGLDPKVENTSVSLYQMQDFGAIDTSEFIFSVRLQNTFEKSATGCRRAQVYLIYEGGAIGIPLSNKGCVATLNIMAFGQFIDGKKTDLSAFGVDFSDSVQLQLLSKDGELQIFVNDHLAYQMQVLETPAKIRGISLHFEGTGRVEQVELSNTKNLVYQLSE
ncbi:hypothetical protein [Pseudozobellia sp. WGM2]|uniref:hypothetical protein n=1 Tax=Pseudozobellia sp. WGM2 TaxID=2787625 RepID=UPI001ADF112B|nr:hypothetical protein [Pseudozobellia sp. WGM2]